MIPIEPICRWRTWPPKLRRSGASHSERNERLGDHVGPILEPLRSRQRSRRSDRNAWFWLPSPPVRAGSCCTMAWWCMRPQAPRRKLTARIAPNQGFVMSTGKKLVLGGRDAARKSPSFRKLLGSSIRKLRWPAPKPHIAEAAAGGAELIVFPEVWLAGYPYWTEGWDSPLPKSSGPVVALPSGTPLCWRRARIRSGWGPRRGRPALTLSWVATRSTRGPEVSTIYNSLLFSIARVA